VLVIADLFLANRGANLSPGPAADRVYDAAWLSTSRDDGHIFRIVNDFGLPGNAGCWLQLEDMAGASPLRLQMHKVMIDAIPRWRMWQLFGVRYVATWEHDLPGPFYATRVAMLGPEWAKDTTYVHRLEPDFSRAWIVHRARQVDSLGALAALASPDFDPYEEALVAEPVQSAPIGAGATSIVDAIAYEPEQITVWADLAAPGWLVLGEWCYPGWHVWVDGIKSEVLCADYGLRAVHVGAGAHEIVFRYRPSSFAVGALVSLAVLVALVGGVLWRSKKGSAGIDWHD
jgi:hypothetical protein